MQQKESADRRCQSETVRQYIVIVGQIRQRAQQVFIGLRLRQSRGNLAGRRPVGLGKDDIEGYRCSAGIGQPLRQPGDLGPRPRPLPQPFDRFLVNVDDPHARVLIGARRGVLIAVKDHQAQPVKSRDGGKLQRRDGQHHQQPGDDRTGFQQPQPVAGALRQIPDPQSHIMLIAPLASKLQAGGIRKVTGLAPVSRTGAGGP